MTSELSKKNVITLDVIRIKKDFPLLQQRVTGKPLVYLDSSATTQKPKSVIQAIEHYYQFDNANVHRGIYALSERATLACETAREKIKTFIHAKHSHEIIFTRGTTDAIKLCIVDNGANSSGGVDPCF